MIEIEHLRLSSAQSRALKLILGQPEGTHMSNQSVSCLENPGAPRWLRGVAVSLWRCFAPNADARGRMRRSLLVVIALLVGVTTLAHAQGVGFADQLTAAEAIWKRAPLRSYEYTLHYGAVVVYTECESLTLRTRVINGVVMRTAGCRTLRSSYSSVPMIFQFLKETLATHPDKIEVTFDATVGYPVRVFVDPRSDITGDEFHFEVTDFKQLK
jgi:Family of unknown function (DUF6174)